MELNVQLLLFTYLILWYPGNAFAEMHSPMNFIDDGRTGLISNPQINLNLPSKAGIEIVKIDQKTGIYIKTNSINVSSIPAGAEIWVDGVNSAKVTPAVINFDVAASHNFELHLNGYETYQENISISGTMTKEVTMVRSISATMKRTKIQDVSAIAKIDQAQIASKRIDDIKILNFYVQITSTPSGAEIWIDGVNTGKSTPDSISFNTAGTHNFELHMAGYEVYQETITVSASMTKEITLTPLLFVRKAILYDTKIFNIEQHQTFKGVLVRIDPPLDLQSKQRLMSSKIIPFTNIVLDSIPQGAMANIRTMYGDVEKKTPAEIPLPYGNSTYELNLDGYKPYKGSFEVSFVKEESNISINAEGVITKKSRNSNGEETTIPTITRTLTPLSGSSSQEPGARGTTQTDAPGQVIGAQGTTTTDTTGQVNGTHETTQTNTTGQVTGAQETTQGSTARATVTQAATQTRSSLVMTTTPSERNMVIKNEANRTLASKADSSLYLHVNSFPQGAQIWIDGKYTQKLTPDKIYFETSGTHTLKLILNGYQIYEESIPISGSMPKEVTLVAIKESSPKGNTQSAPGFPALVVLLAILLVRSVFNYRGL